MADKKEMIERAKNFLSVIKRKAQSVADRLQKKIGRLQWQNGREHFAAAVKIVVSFTKRQPKTASFIYVCLFCAFSIGFLDEPFARYRLSTPAGGFWNFVAELNPSGWWFLILAVLWLVYMAVAGLSLTTEVFERNLVKARAVLFILLTLSLSSLITLVLNILTGRYIPEFLDSMQLYGFSAMRFHVSETSFPSFDVQSVWAVAAAASRFFPDAKKILICAAGVITIAFILTARCFISDAVMGAYIGIIMYYAASWIVSEKRENFPLISL